MDISMAMIKNKMKLNPSAISKQIIAAIGASLGYFVTGNVLGWSSSVLIKMNQDFVVGNKESALVASLIHVGGILGCFMVGFVMDFIGRKKTMIFIAPIIVIGWLAIASATSIWIVYFGRILTGFSIGFLLPATMIYIGETCQANIRGRLGTIPPIFLSCGALISTSLGAYLPWRTSCLLLIIAPVILCCYMTVLPETPYWYLLKSRQKEAEISMRWFRDSDLDTSKELNEISTKLESIQEATHWKEFFASRTRIPMLIALFCQMVAMFSGVTTLTMFTIIIFEKSNSLVDSRIATVLTGVIQVIGSFISMLIVDRIPRKRLLAASSISIGFTMIPLAFYFLSLEYKIVRPMPRWIPVVFINLIIFLYCLGCRSVPWIISSELFNTKIRSAALSVLALFYSLIHFLVVEIFPYAVSSFGYSYVFFFFGAANITFAVLTLIIIPETKGKSFSEIQDYFDKRAETKYSYAKKLREK